MEIQNSAIAKEMQSLSFIGYIHKSSMPKLGNGKNTFKKETDYVIFILLWCRTGLGKLSVNSQLVNILGL